MGAIFTTKASLQLHEQDIKQACIHIEELTFYG